jgi:hypothetical protein
MIFIKGVDAIHSQSKISLIFLLSKRSLESVFGKCDLILMACIILFFFSAIAPVSSASAQVVLFDFDNVPIHTPFPISQTVSSITAHFSATG